MMKWLLLFLSLHAYAQEISFQDLTKAKIGDEITIRGFVSMSKEGQSLLGPIPNIRHCCIKNYPLLQLDKDFSYVFIYQSVIVNGVLQKDNKLENSRLITQ